MHIYTRKKPVPGLDYQTLSESNANANEKEAIKLSNYQLLL